MPNVIQIRDKEGNALYPITDSSLVIGLKDGGIMENVMAWDGTSAPTVANIPAGVQVEYNSTTYTGTLAASGTTSGYIYLVASATQQGEYDRYIVNAAGGSYAWVALSSTQIVSPTIADNLTTNDATKALSAKQGKVLNDELSQLGQELHKLDIKKPSVKLGKNLFDKDAVLKGYYFTGSGTMGANPDYCVSDYISVEPSSGYHISYNNDAAVASSASRFCLYDENLHLVDWSTQGNTKQLTIPSGVYYLRISVYKSYLSAVQVELGTERTSYEAYNPIAGYPAVILDGSITTPKIVDSAVTTSKIVDSAVTLEKTAFAGSINLINKSQAHIGYYLGSLGNLVSNDTYNTTDYIPIVPGEKYCFESSDKPLTNNVRMCCTYNASKAFNTYYNGPSVSEPFVAQEGDAYIRITYYANDWSKVQFSHGALKELYHDYQLLIPSSLIFDDSTPDEEDKVVFFLPKHIYVADGRTIELYYEQICLNANLFNIQATCSIGKALDRKFQIIGDTSHVGNNYTLTIKVYDNIGNLLKEATSTIHIVSNVISSAKNVLPIGDSLTNQKPWLAELSVLSPNISTVGTRENRHEGRSGASCTTYLNVTGEIVYSYDREYRGPGYGTAPDFSESDAYTAGTIVKTAYNSGYRYWVFLVNHSAGAFVQSECFCLSDGNPFYDFQNQKFSMSFYKTYYSKTYDAIIIYLGANGMNLTPATNPNGALGIKNLIELIREDEPTIPIIVIETIFRSNQNGIGNQGNTDGYTAQSEYKFNADKKTLLLAQAIEELCGSMANVYICPVAVTHDSKYNFGNNKIQVNPRLTSTDVVYELNPNDSVHPQECGYLQMADEMFSILCAVFNPE